VLAIVSVAVALGPLVRGGEEIPTGLHHLLHAGAIAIAAACGLVAAAPPPPGRAWENPKCLAVAVGAPVLAMVLMWPSEYAWLDQHPLGHAVEHLGLIVLGFASAYGGQQYARGIGWASALVLVAMAVVAAFGFGVAPAPTA
jgi:hypothetical protein